MQRDRVPELTRILREIENASDFCELRTIHDRMPVVAAEWRNQGVGSCRILSSVNEWHDKLIARTIELVLADMESAGLGTPPSPFCWLLLGSGGRREQTLHPDQDNALVYLDGPDTGASGKQAAFFETLAERAVTRLSGIGYPYCSGFVMATNKRWNLPLNGWRQNIESYSNFPDWTNTRFLMMMADIRPVYGDAELAARLRVELLERIRHHSFVHWQVVEHGLSDRIPLDFLDRLLVERRGDHKGEINIKEGGYLQIVKITRLWAVASGIGSAATEERIADLKAMAVWDEALAGRVMGAFRTFAGHRLWSNYVSPDSLSADETEALKEAMKTAKYLQRFSSKHFRKPK